MKDISDEFVLSLISLFQVTALFFGIALLLFLLRYFKYNVKGFALLAIFLGIDLLVTAYDFSLLRNYFVPYPHWSLILAFTICLSPLLLKGYLSSLCVISMSMKQWLQLLLFPVFFLLLVLLVTNLDFFNKFHESLFKDSTQQYIFYGAISSIYCSMMLYPITKVQSKLSFVKRYLLGLRFIVYTYWGNTLSFLMIASLAISNDVLFFLKLILLVMWILSVYFLVISVLYFLPFGAQNHSARQQAELPPEDDKYEESNNRDSEGVVRTALLTKFDDLLDKNEIFRDSRIQMDDVAGMLNTTAFELRTALKTVRNDSFKSVINQKRVGYIKNNIESTDQKPNFLDLAYEAGFNSKATFNRVFKQVTNKSPSEYFDTLKGS